MNPVSANPRQNAATRCALSSGERALRNPITGTAACCARDESGHAAAPPSSVINWRRLMSSIGPSFCRRSPLPATGRGGRSTAYLPCHGARGQILGPSLNLSESRQIAASAAPVLPPKTIAQRYHGKLLQRGISIRPMSAWGHSRPSQPILPVGALPLRPETGLEAGPANKEDAPVVHQWHAARFVRKHRVDGDPLLSCRPNGPRTSDRRGGRRPLSTYLCPEHPSHH